MHGKQENLPKENRKIFSRKTGESSQGKQENLLKEKQENLLEGNRRIYSRKTGQSTKGKQENLKENRESQRNRYNENVIYK